MATQAATHAVTSPEALQAAAKSLPNLLTRFFAKFPPGRPYATEAQKPPRPEPVTRTSETGSVELVSEASEEEILRASTPFADPTYNPFLPWRNPITHRWRSPYYGLRRQAVLCKLAEKHGVESLLPWSMKLSAVKLEKRMTRGLRVKGTGEGEKVKGHKWERMMKGKLRERKEAMMKMPETIQEWKQRGHGRGWKKYPK